MTVTGDLSKPYHRRFHTVRIRLSQIGLDSAEIAGQDFNFFERQARVECEGMVISETKNKTKNNKKQSLAVY